MSLAFLLKSFTEEDKPKAREKDEVSLTGVLQRERLKLSKLKAHRKASFNFSPYNVGYGFCMRERVAQLASYHTILVKPPTPKELMVMDVGKKYHELIQGYFWKCDMLEGYWKCSVCNDEFWARSPKVCADCKAARWYLEYREVPLTNEEYHIRGRADGILYIEHNKVEERHLVDIKSISNRGAQQSPQDPRLHFEDLDEQGPLLPHVIQLMLYQMMSKIPDAHLLYVGKNSQQMKSFHIKYNEKVLAPYLATISEALKWAKDLKEGTRKDLPAPCSSKKCECEKIIRKEV